MLVFLPCVSTLWVYVHQPKLYQLSIKKKKRKENLWSQLKSHTVKISALQVILRFILKCNLHFFHKCLKYLINDTLILVSSFVKLKNLLQINEFNCKRSNFY